MQLKDILHISTKNFHTHLKRNLMVIAIMGILFGLIFSINLFLQGIENNYINFTNHTTKGKTIISATSFLSNDPDSQGYTDEEIIRDIKEHNGTVIGQVDLFENIILPPSYVQSAIKYDVKAVPDDAIPVLASDGFGNALLDRDLPNQYNNARKKLQDYETFRQDLIGKTFIDYAGAKYFVVGLAPGNFNNPNLSFQQLERSNVNILNPILELISTPLGSVVIIDNGKGDTWIKASEPSSEMFDSDWDIPSDYHKIIAIFDSADLVYKYFRNSQGLFTNSAFDNRKYSVDVIAGVSPENIYVFNLYKFITYILYVILGIIAAIIIIFTSIRLVDQDRPNIALYYSLGATRRQVRTIYLFYFVELMLGSLIFAFGLASIVVCLFSVIYQDLLSIQAIVSYSLDTAPYVMWYGVNLTTLIITVVILMIGPICLLVNRRRIGSVNFDEL